MAFIEKMLIPEIGRRYGLEENIKDIPVILGGYSLAGLFALWSAYQESCAVKFAAAAGMSPSVWFRMAGIYENKTDTNEKGISQPGRP